MRKIRKYLISSKLIKTSSHLSILSQLLWERQRKLLKLYFRSTSMGKKFKRYSI